ncbi:MAG: hypothetical protein AAFW60_11620, partial [Pseudomonadota bacterium]
MQQAKTFFQGIGIAVAGGLLLGACGQIEPEIDLPPLASADDSFPDLHSVPSRPIPAQTLDDRREVTASLVASLGQERGAAALSRNGQQIAAQSDSAIISPQSRPDAAEGISSPSDSGT